MNLHQFYFDSWILAKKMRWRIGQALFNNLMDVRPELAEKLRGTKNDPFFSESPTDPRYDAAIKIIEKEWFEDASPRQDS